MFRFLHRLWNPHCHHCVEERINEKVCDSCEILKMQLALTQQEKKELLDLIVDKNRDKAEPVQSKTPEPIRPRVTPWSVKKQILEAESREQARILAQQKEIDKLEKQILESDKVEDATEPRADAI